MGRCLYREIRILEKQWRRKMALKEKISEGAGKTSKMFTEFKEFINRGNVVDMAVGVIIATAFGAIVNSLVNDIFMPFVGYLLAGVDFSKMSIVLREAVGEQPALAIGYGSLIQKILNFLVIALCIFFVVKGINRLRRKEEAKADEAAPEEEPVVDDHALLEGILGELKKLNEKQG